MYYAVVYLNTSLDTFNVSVLVIANITDLNEYRNPKISCENKPPIVYKRVLDEIVRTEFVCARD